MNILSVLCDAGIKLGSPEKMSDSLLTYSSHFQTFKVSRVCCGMWLTTSSLNLNS